MEDKKPKNPQAFPSEEFDFRGSQATGGTCFKNYKAGMSLRDYFAAKAMQGEMATQSEENGMYMNPEDFKLLANLSYKIADAMLEAREK